MHSLRFLLVGVVVSLGCNSIPCMGQEIIRIEEDWELHVIQPDAKRDAPQVTTTAFPLGNNSSLLFQFDLNHASLPDFESGGMQIRICNDDHLLNQKRLYDGIKLDNDGETVSWTQVFHNTADGYYFGISRGSSSSFGSFGDHTTYAYISHHTAGDDHLDDYRYTDSIEDSGVAFAGNRVGHLRLKKVRPYVVGDLLWEKTLNVDVQ
ncbi:MAG: hypothetical protein VXZ82_05335 [Planctomycetota bacterium]|nr:hypothetical protein [Planctomycetota bacterium]